LSRHSISTAGARQPGAWAFAILYAVESFSRASLVSIVPIQAYDLLESKQGVSILFFVVGVFGILATLSAPILFGYFRRRTVYVLGALALVAASACFASYTLAGQAAGMFLRIVGAGALNIALSLYIMEYIPRHGFVRSESLRLALATLAWTFAPWFGVWLYVRYGHVAPYLWSAAWAVILIGIFFLFRLTGHRRSPVTVKPATPLANIRRFIAQPRMRLAWLIAFGDPAIGGRSTSMRRS
jgi:MFS family permease